MTRVALVHDWLTGMRGGEKVLEQLCAMYPKAPVYTLFHLPGSVSEVIESHEIHTSFLQHAPFLAGKYRNYLPLFPAAIERFDLRDYDLVISSSHCVAKGVISGGAHICYCHTPMRYVWSNYHDYFGDHRVGMLKRAVIPVVASRLRMWDVSSCNRVDHFVANSAFVQGRIRRYYGRESTVIHPPVDVDFFTPSENAREDFFLIVSALVPYKRLEIPIEAFRNSRSSLVIVGTGPEEKRLARAAAGSDRIRFLGRVRQEELRELYRRAAAMIMPAIEDFGINVVEAQACGCPVIAYRGGGAMETVVDGGNGVFFDELDPGSLQAAVDRCGRVRFNIPSMRELVLRFAPSRFREEMNAVIHKMYDRAENG